MSAAVLQLSCLQSSRYLAFLLPYPHQRTNALPCQQRLRWQHALSPKEAQLLLHHVDLLHDAAAVQGPHLVGLSFHATAAAAAAAAVMWSGC
jgi:hypothetical protein